MITVKESEQELQEACETSNTWILTVEGVSDPFKVSLETTEPEAGINLVHIKLVSPVSAHLAPLKLSWILPAIDIHGIWQPGSDRSKSLIPDWFSSFTTNVTSNMPVTCLHNLNGENRLTFALSDALNTLNMQAGVHEESATIHCSITLFTEMPHPISSYEAILRLDTRPLPYYQCLEQVRQWWAAQPNYQPVSVPEAARLPVYSTWYSFHQMLTASDVEHQCRMAKALGCETVIVDDGWQTVDTARRYTYCGDWEVAPQKIPDMKAHVTKVHELGLKYILWYPVPFVGIGSKVWSRFSNYLLGMREELNVGVLDPRFPEVRNYLITTYKQALCDWDVDGFKLDFVDDFKLSYGRNYEYGHGRDYLSVPEAVDRLLTDIITALKAIKSDVLIEFRQSYVGPLMHKYANMFRAGDCPYDIITNRVRTLDIRLLSGNMPAHSDMLMWHKDESVESAALQIINILFAVPQISVLLDTIPFKHLSMIEFWLDFWRTHRDVFLDGTLMPLHPEMLYPIVMATTQTKQVVVVYQDVVVELNQPTPDELILINGTHKRYIVIYLKDDLGARMLKVHNCYGEVVSTREIELSKGPHVIELPSAGVAIACR